MHFNYDVVMIPLQLIIVFFTIYYFVVSWFGLFGKMRETKQFPEKSTFALIVCAHNEQQVIAKLVENLKQLNYSDKLYDIFVVADNCVDKTAEAARNAGAIVERFSETGKGKGFAMEWMFHRLFGLERQYDAVCVFDADNLVHPDFLKIMNNHLCSGERLIQGYMDSKNPEDTWVSGMFSISFWIVNHIWHLAKYNIGLSCVLGGTGMCIDTKLLKQYGWGATCLTEDMEFTMKALMENIPTTWAHDAVIYDEKPLTFKAAWNQRKRWAQGHFDVANRYIPKMLWKGITEHNIVVLDGMINLVQPYFLLLSTFFVFCTYIYNLVPFYTNVLYEVLPIQVWQIIGVLAVSAGLSHFHLQLDSHCNAWVPAPERARMVPHPAHAQHRLRRRHHSGRRGQCGAETGCFQKKIRMISLFWTEQKRDFFIMRLLFLVIFKFFIYN